MSEDTITSSGSESDSGGGDEVKRGELLTGTVKWFNDAKGFGFIEHTSGKDVFVHYSVIEAEGFKTLKDGEMVEYELKEGAKGLHALRVIRRVKSTPATLVSAIERQVDGDEADEVSDGSQPSPADGTAAEGNSAELAN